MASKKVKQLNEANRNARARSLPPPPRPPHDWRPPDLSRILPLYYTVKEKPRATRRD